MKHFNKTKEDLIKEIEELESNIIKYPNRYIKFENLEIDNKSELRLIKHNCIDRKCLNYSTIQYKNITYHICYDDWSTSSIGWHVIYSETLDLCFDKKNK